MPTVLTSGSLNLLEPSGPVQACNEIALPLSLPLTLTLTLPLPLPLPLPYYLISLLTFKNRASYIWDGRTSTLQMLHFIYFFQQL